MVCSTTSREMKDVVAEGHPCPDTGIYYPRVHHGESLVWPSQVCFSHVDCFSAETILASSRFRSLSAFTSIYGIGPSTARQLYSLGLRTIQDLERYYEVEQGTEESEKVKMVIEQLVHLEDDDGTQDGMIEMSIRVALALRHDFSATWVVSLDLHTEDQRASVHFPPPVTT